MPSRPSRIEITLSLLSVLALLAPAAGAQLTQVPTDIQQPGTQPGQGPNLPIAQNCDNCHGGYDPAVEPATAWGGSMMAHAGRDPIFWATVAVAEADFGGSGDLCLRCHAPKGWLEGRSTPTDGSALAHSDRNGVECIICHKVTNPDDSEFVGAQMAPFIANDEGTPPVGYYGSAMYVTWNGGERLGPYNDANSANHPFAQSQFHRESEMCGTCHDVSNPAVGDLAPNNGAQTPLAPGTFSGVSGAPVSGKAAFNNFPYAYGLIERTYSEWKASLWGSTPVSSFSSLPLELQGGAVEDAWQAALVTGMGGNYADGSTRTFTCQSCHMPPVVGKGCDKNNAPIRQDLPHHTMNGGNYWMPEVIQYLDGQGKLVLGGGLNSSQVAALNAGALRARDNLEAAAKLEVQGSVVKVVNLTGHKLISGYPEGRRMWLNIRWYGPDGSILREDGAYGPLTATINGSPVVVETLLDLSGANTRIYDAHFGMSQEWASALIGLGYSPALPLEYDRTSGATVFTLGTLASQPPGTTHDSFHFVLNDVLVKDTRIPPYGMSYDAAVTRNLVPVPGNQYGNPGAGGTYDHWDMVTLNPPANAAWADIDLLYQPTSWEYVQFLHLASSTVTGFLGSVGADLLDAWLNTGMAAPHVMASASWCPTPGSGEDFSLETEVNGGGNLHLCIKTAGGGDLVAVTYRSPDHVFDGQTALLVAQAFVQGFPPAGIPGFPELHVADPGFVIFSLTPQLPATGVNTSFVVPAGLAGIGVRFQAVAFGPMAGNGYFAASDAHDILLQ